MVIKVAVVVIKNDSKNKSSSNNNGTNKGVILIVSVVGSPPRELACGCSHVQRTSILERARESSLAIP